MVSEFKGPYSYSRDVIEKWNSTAIGIYYCGTPTSDGGIRVFYVGKATSDIGIRGRLLQHLSERKWMDVTHFGYKTCEGITEAEKHEENEIRRLQPKYNIVGK
jgi:excinuclease UvrABC nuclease subunit